MKLFTGTIVGVVVLAFAIAHPTAQGMPKPAPEMKSLEYFNGNWTCKGKAEKSPISPEGALSGSVQIKHDLGGFWQTGTVKATMAGMGSMEGRFYTTYDPGSKRFLMFWGDSMGSWAQTTSSGWQGESMVFEGESTMPGQKAMKSRDTFKRGADGTMTHMWEAEMDGKWTKLGEETCRKSGKPATGK